MGSISFTFNPLKMTILIPVLIVAIILGAILGGKSFGGVVSKGCGFLAFIVSLTIVIIALIYAFSGSEETPNNIEEVTSGAASGYFIVKQDCEIYTKPNIESDVSGQLVIGDEYLIENVDRFNFFYRISDDSGENSYVRKECLNKK